MVLLKGSLCGLYFTVANWLRLFYGESKCKMEFDPGFDAEFDAEFDAGMVAASLTVFLEKGCQVLPAAYGLIHLCLGCIFLRVWYEHFEHLLDPLYRVRTN